MEGSQGQRDPRCAVTSHPAGAQSELDSSCKLAVISDATPGPNHSAGTPPRRQMMTSREWRGNSSSLNASSPRIRLRDRIGQAPRAPCRRSDVHGPRGISGPLVRMRLSGAAVGGRRAGPAWVGRAVYVAYATARGSAFIGRELYLPRARTGTAGRCRDAGVILSRLHPRPDRCMFPAGSQLRLSWTASFASWACSLTCWAEEAASSLTVAAASAAVDLTDSAAC